MSARYAIYYAPAAASPWWAFGAHWLGRDEIRNQPLLQQPLTGFSPEEFQALTAAPRRYGFHATLKAPFRLRHGATEAQLRARLAQLARPQRQLALPTLQPAYLDGFVALVPAAPAAELQALAARCVTELDDLRAPLTPDELERRAPDRLDPRARQLLTQFGYPHVLERFRFHLTLTGPVQARTAVRLLRLLAPPLATLQEHAPLQLDRLCLFVERQPGAPFVRLHDEELAP